MFLHPMLFMKLSGKIRVTQKTMKMMTLVAAFGFFPLARCHPESQVQKNIRFAFFQTTTKWLARTNYYKMRVHAPQMKPCSLKLGSHLLVLSSKPVNRNP